MEFEIHPNLEQKDFIIDLPLCRVLLENDSNFPWIFLVPRRNCVSKIMDLEPADQLQLLKELDLAQNVIWKSFDLTQLNVAAIGNKTPQLHVHIIGRKIGDPAWPGTVWEHSPKLPYPPEEKNAMIKLLQAGFNKHS